MSYQLLDALARTPMGSTAKAVLNAMACHADNKTFETFVGTKTIVKHTGLTRRYVITVRNKLELDGWISNTGKTHHIYGTIIYRILVKNIPPEISKECITNLQAVLSTAQACASQSTHLCSPIHPNQSVESVNLKSQLKTSAADAALAYASKKHHENLKKEKIAKVIKQEAKQASPEGAPPPVPPAPLPVHEDSQLVKAWKSAHIASGRPTPLLSALECAQLSQLAKGKHALDYATVRDTLIPEIVMNWENFCTWASAWTNIHKNSKSPMPNTPCIGFVLTYRLVAEHYALLDKETKLSLLEIKKQAAPFGKMPMGVPKPNKWNTPFWKDHPNEVTNSKSVGSDSSSPDGDHEHYKSNTNPWVY